MARSLDTIESEIRLSMTEANSSCDYSMKALENFKRAGMAFDRMAMEVCRDQAIHAMEAHLDHLSLVYERMHERRVIRSKDAA